jgi:hypothetical protein
VKISKKCNQKPQVEEQITIQWPNEKGKRANNDPQSTSRKINN